MSKYTITVEEIVQAIWDEGHPNGYDMDLPEFSSTFSDDDTKIKYALSTIFNFSFPYYGTSTDKEALEYDIISDYYFHEINCDTVGRWQRMLRNRLHDIMPKYVQIYNAQMQLISSDILNPYRIDETRTHKIDTIKDKQTELSSTSESSIKGESNSNSMNHNEGVDNTETSNTNKFSDTPQALLDQNKDYLTNLTKDDGTNENTYSSDINASDTTTNKSDSTGNVSNKGKESDTETKLDDYVRIVKGNLTKDNNAKLIKAYEDVIMNIEGQIVQDLRNLFYLVF